MEIRVGGLRFIGDAGPALYSIERDGIRGLSVDGVGVRRESVERPAAHGAYSLPGFLTGRSIRWSGFVETDDAAEQDHALRALSGLLAGGSSGRLIVQDQTTLWVDVMRAGEPSIEMLDYGLLAKYTFEAWAPDPRLYGESRDFAGGAVAYHYGNFEATPVHRVTGTSSAYTINGPSGLAFTVSSGPGSGVDLIDMGSGRVTRNGVLLLGAVSRADLWTVPPGAPGVVHTVTAGSLTTTVVDTFV